LHIKGLLINFLDQFFGSLLKIPNFLVEFVTPIVRVSYLIAIMGARTDSPAQVSKGKQIDLFTIPKNGQWL
jgi:DNA topoisomerase-2